MRSHRVALCLLVLLAMQQMADGHRFWGGRKHGKRHGHHGRKHRKDVIAHGWGSSHEEYPMPMDGSPLGRHGHRGNPCFLDAVKLCPDAEGPDAARACLKQTTSELSPRCSASLRAEDACEKDSTDLCGRHALEGGWWHKCIMFNLRSVSTTCRDAMLKAAPPHLSACWSEGQRLCCDDKKEQGDNSLGCAAKPHEMMRCLKDVEPSQLSETCSRAMHEHKRKHFNDDFMESEGHDVDRHHRPKVSVIIGAVAAGVAGVGLAVVGGMYLVRRHRMRARMVNGVLMREEPPMDGPTA